jgi:integrase
MERTMTDPTSTTTDNPDASKGATTAKPKGERWAHVELLAALKNPAITRVSEAGGLYGVVRRGKDGAPSVMFRWRFRHDNKLADFTAGSWPGDSLKDIREAHAWAIDQHKAGKNPSTERQLSKAQAAHTQATLARAYTEETVRALSERWQQAELVKRGTKGRKDNGTEVIRSFERDIFPTLGDRPLASIKRAEWAELFDQVKVRSPRMALRLFADARQFLDWCSRRDYIEVNPLHKLKRDDIAPAYKERERVLWDSKSPTPHAELLELREKLPNARLQRTTELALWIMLGTACRVGELSIARWEHVDLANRRWHIPAPKNGVPHDVYLSDFTLRYLKELHSLTGHTSWCFPADNKRDADGNPTSHVCVKSIGKQVKDRQRTEAMKNRSKATGALCLSGGPWTPHDTRRTAATIMGACGVSGELVERAINHVPNKLVRTYQKSDRWPELVTAWTKLGAELDRLLHGTEAKVIAFPTKAA